MLRKIAPVAAVLLAFAAPRLRAQVTETPTTIAPGKFSVRMDALSLGFDRANSDDNRFTALGLGSTILSTGVTQDVDAQLGVDLFLRQTVRLRGKAETHSGLGDVRLRMKWRFWHGGEWEAEAAVIPFIKVPTHRGGVSNDHIEGGVIFPWAAVLALGVQAGAMAELDVTRNETNTGYESRRLLTGFLRRSIASTVSLYAEGTLGSLAVGAPQSGGTLGAGATLAVTKHFQADYSLARGVNSQATDWTHTLRLRWDF